nr:hypothetical protein [Tanacetum cinerariifolium]
CQPITFQIDFSDFDQIQTPQYPEIHSPSLETSDEVFQANHSIQKEESFENSSSNQEKEEPIQESEIHQLIRKECCVEDSEEQKQSMEDTMLKLVKICQEKEFLCIHDDVDDLIESALNSKLLLINSNSQHLDKKEQEVKNVVEQPAERGNCNIQSLQNFRVVHKSSISFNTSQISSIHAIAPFLSTKEPKHLLNIEYVEASLSDPENVSIEEENSVEEENPDQERLINLAENDILDNSSNDTLLEEAYLFLFDNSIPPGIENIADDPEGDIRFLEELLIDDSILSHESPNSNFEDNPSNPRPPPEPPDAETDAGEEIPVVMIDKDKFDDDYHFSCLISYEKSHETFQCQPITFQIDFSGSDQIQTPQYPKIHFSSQETSNEVFQANHSIQNEESFENPSNEIAVSNTNQEKEEPSQESDIHQLIGECSIEVSEKQKMKDTMLELVKIFQEKEFLCIHDDIDDLIERSQNVIEQSAERGNRSIQSLQNFRVVHKSSISFNTSQISSIHAITPILSTKEPEHLLSIGYEHLSITPITESDEVTESNAENLLPILSECEVTLEDKKECDLPISEDSPVCVNHSDVFSDSKIDDDISVYDDDFEDIEYVEASLSDPENVSIEEENSVEEENVVQQEEEEIDLEGISQIQDERLINLMKNDISDSSNDPLLEEADLFLSDNSIPPGIENVADDPEGDICFLEELLIDDSILYHESSDSTFEDNPSAIVKFECIDARVKFDDFNDEKDVLSYFMFVIFAKEFSLLSAESEDPFFDPGVSD